METPLPRSEMNHSNSNQGSLASRSPISFQTISVKTEAHDGRLGIGTAERLRAQHG